MKIYARVYEGEVQELFSTDGDITQMFHPDMIWVDITELSPQPVPGWSAVESTTGWAFAAPVIVPPTDDELKAAALAKRDALLSQASEVTAGMGDAFLADLLNDADKATFKTYAAYKLALNKIDKQPGYPQTIAWPTLPQ